ncbi:MAG: acyltransferase [Clostridiales bacterium]|nr:acyltransferase [Clostridiales bacterium]
MKAKQRNGKIELLRFVFSVIVMLFHAGNIEGYGNVLFKSGAFAVEFFFIVSGYLMAASIAKANSSGELSLGTETFLFLKKKVIGIYPELFFSYIISVAIYTLAGKLNFGEVVDLITRSLGDLTLIKMTGIGVKSVNGNVWYISSMLLVMAILYPLIRRYKDVMLKIVLPVAALLAFGFLCQETGVLRSPGEWMGWTYRGNPRAFAGVSLGAVCYPLSQKLGRVNLTGIGKWLCTIAEWGIYLFVLRFTYFGTSSKLDYFYVLFMAAAVVITFSRQSVDAALFDNKVCYWLGKFSLPVFLSHSAWCKQIDALAPADASVEWRVAAYIVCSVVTAFAVYFISVLWRKAGPSVRKRLSKMLVKG